MKPRVTAVAAVVLALAVVVAPVGGAHKVTFIHTTESELSAGTTSNMIAYGGSDGNLMAGNVGTTATRDADDNSGSTSQHYGVAVTPNTALNGITITTSSNVDGATIVKLTQSDGTVITTAPISGGTARLVATMESGTEYGVIVGADGASYTYGEDSAPNYPYTSSDIDITAKAQEAGTGGTTQAFNVKDVTAITAPATANYTGAAHGADNPSTGFANVTVQDATVDVVWEGSNDGSSWTTVNSTTVSSSGNYSLELSGGYSKWRANVDAAQGTGGYEAQLHDEGVTGVQTTAPTVDNASADPQGGEKVNSDPVTLSIPVEDADFGDAEGDTVTVEFFGNGNSVGTDTLTANGTASTTWSPELGDNEWYAVATDDYGHSQQSQTFKFETPSNITFRNETNASDIITGTTAQVTFYSVSGTIVIQKTDSDGDGKIDLAGLPNTAFVVTTDVDGFYNRRIYIDSIYNQQNIYLLNSTAYGGAGSVNTTFVYEDRTGAFEQSNTTLEVERAVDPDGDGNFEWQVVAGDFWGAAGEFPFSGQTQARYRLVITNQQTGDRRVLGTHVPTSDGVKNIIVGKVVFDAENATGRYVDAEINQNTSNLQILYSDPANSSTDVQIIVHEQGNKSNELYNQTFAGPLGTKTITLALNDSQASSNWIVTYDVGDSADGPKFHKVVVGGGRFPLPIDGDILASFSYLFVTFVMLLYGPRTALLGAWAGVIVFAGFAFLGWVSGVAVAVPVLIAIGATFYSAATP